LATFNSGRRAYAIWAEALQTFISKNNLPVVGTFQAAGAVGAMLKPRIHDIPICSSKAPPYIAGRGFYLVTLVGAINVCLHRETAVASAVMYLISFYHLSSPKFDSQCVSN
jgi:hypothetical protein